MELEKTQTRYLIVGLLISFVISFLLWQLSRIICKRKQATEVKSSSSHAPVHHKNKKKN
jgi:predicted permease